MTAFYFEKASDSLLEPSDFVNKVVFVTLF